MKNLSFLLWLLIFLQAADSQAQQRSQDKSEITIKGSIIDRDTKTPIAYTTISVFAKKDSSLLGGGITDNLGMFEVTSPPDDLWIEFDFIGYSRVVIDDLAMVPGKKVFDIGERIMSQKAVNLDAVEVRAEKSTTQFDLDKRIFNVGKDLASRGGNAQDILDQVPSVNVDVEGNVSLRGSQGVRILLNGKISGLVGIGDANGLRNIPAELIEKVEVITNPSARYEAEGSTGIINIVLKEDKRSGFNGSFDFITGDPYKLGVGINTNYRSGNLNYFGTYSVRDNRSPGLSQVYQENYFEDRTRASFINRDFQRSGINQTFRGGLGYYINEKTVLTFSGLYRTGRDENNNLTTYQDYILPAGSRFVDRNTLNGANLIMRPQIETENESNSEFEINLDKEFGKKHTFRTSLTYRSQSEVERSIIQEYIADSKQNRLADPYLFQNTNNDEGEGNLVFIADYVKPVGKEGSFEAGVRSTIRDIENDYLVEEKDDNGVFQSLPNFSNVFLYDEDVYAAYSQYGNKIGKISYMGGLRMEHSRVITELAGTDEINDRTYTNLFPSLFLNYEISGGDGLQLSYSKRIRRPRFWYLNPFFGFSDPRNFFGGNPNLDPSFSENYELGYLKYFDKGTITSGIYYRHETGVIERIQKEDADDPSIVITRPENLSTEDNYGFEFVGNFRPTNWWRMDGNLNIFRSKTEGSIGDQDFSADTYTWSGQATTRFTFWRRSDLQFRFRYRAGRQTTQGNSEGIGTTDVAFSKDFLNDNLTVTLNIRDLFNSRRRIYETITEDFYNDGFFQWRIRDISLNINYRLNMKKQRQRSSRESTQDFEGGEF